MLNYCSFHVGIKTQIEIFVKIIIVPGEDQEVDVSIHLDMSDSVGDSKGNACSISGRTA